MFRLLAGISLLRGETSVRAICDRRERSLLKADDFAVDRDPVAMPLVPVARLVFPIEHRAWWIKRAPQRPTVDPIDKRAR